MKIALIGPTYPFRGGIAHYTTILCRTLRRNHHVKFISFKRQYPKILFPGTSDRDTSEKPVQVDDVEYIIDSLNPVTWLKAARSLREYDPERLVFPWWVAFWTPQFLSIIALIRRHIECHVVLVCHNVVEHESNSLKKFSTKLVLSRGDTLITHSGEETRKLRKLLGDDAPVVTAFHPTYADLSDVRYTKEQAKTMLGIDGDVLLFFGFVREYKGLHVLLDAMPAVLKDRDVTLLVVGEFWKDKRKYLEQIDRLGISSHIVIIDRYVPNEEIGVYFASADLVVQPYLSVSGSGISQIAYGFDRPVIATNVGSLSEVVEDGVNGRLVESADSRGLAKAILESLDPEVQQRFLENASETKMKFSWEKMADIITGERESIHV